MSDNGLMTGLAPISAPTDPFALETDQSLRQPFENQLIRPLPRQDEGPGITDVSGTAGMRDVGRFQSNPTGMIIHHTGAVGSVDSVVKSLKEQGFGSQFIIDRDGKTYQIYPDGAVGYHIKDGWGPQGGGKTNHNMEGVEVIAGHDNEVNDAQKQAAARLVAARSRMWGYDPKTSVFGHGEVNPGHKEPTEGYTIANGIRTGSLALPDYSNHISPVSIQAGKITPLGPPASLTPAPTASAPAGTPTPVPQLWGTGAPPTGIAGTARPGEGTPVSTSPTPATTNALAPGGATQPPFNPSETQAIAVPEHISPLLNYWADYHGLDRDVFARMIRHESGFDPSRKGSSGEVGLGQLMPGTAEELGVKDRTDINENLRGAAQYLRKQLDDPRVQGDYRKALMLYNSGPGGSFKNTEYADAVLQGPAGVRAGDKLAGGYRAGGAVPAAFPALSQPTATAAGTSGAAGTAGTAGTAGNALAAGPGGRVKPQLEPPAGGEGGQADWVPPQDPNAVEGIDRQARLMQMLGIARAFAQGIKFTPVNYDPFKISRQGEVGSYSPKPVQPIRSSTTVSGIPVRELNISPARGTKPTQAA